MTDYNEGDLIEAVKGETVIRARLTHVPDNVRPLAVLTVAIRSDILHLEANGYTVTLLERAKPKLPTDWGLYLDAFGGVWRLTFYGAWTYIDTGVRPVNAIDAGPFTRLVPEVTP